MKVPKVDLIEEIHIDSVTETHTHTQWEQTNNQQGDVTL